MCLSFVNAFRTLPQGTLDDPRLFGVGIRGNAKAPREGALESGLSGGDQIEKKLPSKSGSSTDITFVLSYSPLILDLAISSASSTPFALKNPRKGTRNLILWPSFVTALKVTANRLLITISLRSSKFVTEPILVAGSCALAGGLARTRANNFSNPLPVLGLSTMGTSAIGLENPGEVEPILIFPGRVAKHSLVRRFPIKVLSSALTFIDRAVLMFVAKKVCQKVAVDFVGRVHRRALGLADCALSHVGPPFHIGYNRRLHSFGHTSGEHRTNRRRGSGPGDGRVHKRLKAIVPLQVAKLAERSCGAWIELCVSSFTSRCIIPNRVYFDFFEPRYTQALLKEEIEKRPIPVRTLKILDKVRAAFWKIEGQLLYKTAPRRFCYV